MKWLVGRCSGVSRSGRRQVFMWGALSLLVMSVTMSVGCQKTTPKGKLVIQSPIHLDRYAERLLLQWKLKPSEFATAFSAKVKKSKWLHAVSSRKVQAGQQQVHAVLSFIAVPPRFIHKRVRNKGRLFAVARVQLRLRTLPKTDNYNIEEYALLPYLPKKPPGQKAVQANLRRVWQKGLRSLELWGQLSSQSSSALRAVLQRSSNKMAIRHAIVLLGRRVEKGAVMDIVRHLQTNNRFVVMAAIGALTKLKDRRASAPLIKASRGRSIAFQAQILSALGEIGGPQALSHLYTLSTAHPNRTIRLTAKEAYKEIVMREKRGKVRK